MPDLKLVPLLEAAQPAQLEPRLRAFLGPAGAPIRVESTRLQATVCYWAVYRRGGRVATLKSFFSEELFRSYVHQLEQLYPEQLGDATHAAGGVVVLPEVNGFLWGFPFDPGLPELRWALEVDWVARALGGRRRKALEWELLGYSPEMSALLRYRSGRRLVAYGKVTAEQTDGHTYRVMEWLWNSPLRETVELARPLAVRPEAGFLLQGPVPGRPLGRERNRQIFLKLARVAGGALAQIHRSGVPFGRERRLQQLIGQVEENLDDLRLIAPGLYGRFRALMAQLKARGRSGPTELVPSHGDFKYDQFLERAGRFSLLDFEFFCQAERALDVGWFCAYLPPSSPEDWREGVAVELLRSAFLQSYQEAARGTVDLHRVGLYEAAALALRALTYAWSYEQGWELRASAFLDLAFERMVAPEPQNGLRDVGIL